MPLSPGTKLGTYTIESALGSGGMGDVYKALDTKLNRHVALKVLPEILASDPERLKRFEQEARAASALDHPNIITIHDIHLRQGFGGQVAEGDNYNFIVMQYVEGKTVRELMQEGPIELKQALRYAVQAAEGLVRAHDKGIVHRDLKPANLMVTEDGLVKVLDFGLAKLTEPENVSEAETRDLDLKTKEGHILGTVPYMSPEQAQGKKVDHRSDIFSFGCVLYEMVTGKRAFPSDSMAGTLAAIIKDDPRKVSDLAPAVPLDVERVITRCLRKEPERRYQSMADLRLELVDIKEAVDSGKAVATSQIRKKEAPSFERKWLWGLVAILVVGIASWIILGPGGGDRPPRFSSPIPITSLEGYETQPALSPDGKMVAFAGFGMKHGPADIYVKLVDEGEPLQLTHGPADDQGPTWSHDGTKVAFSRRQPDGTCGVMEVSALGGPERRLTVAAPGPMGGCGFRPLDYSPDGRFLVMRDGKGLSLLSLDTGEKTELTSPPDPENDRAPAFSPDGSRVAFVRDFNRVPGGEIRIQPVDGGEQVLVPSEQPHVNQLDWAPSGKALVCALVGRQLWWVPLSGEKPTQLEVGDDALHVSIAPATEPHPRMVFTERGPNNSNIYRLNGPASSEPSLPMKLPSSSTRGDFGPDISPDGTRIAFASSRKGANGVWVCEIGDDDSCIELSERGMTPRWSPDGKKIAYRSKAGVWVVDADGGIPVRVTEEGIDAGVPAWSNDGKWIYFGDVSEMQLWKIPTEGGEAVRVTQGLGGPSRESEDGRFLYFFRPGGIWRVPTSGGEETRVVQEKTLGYLNWTLWKDKLIFSISQGKYGTTIRQLDLQTKEATEMATLEAPPSTGLAVSPDGQWLYVVQVEPPEGDLMLVEFLR